MPNAIMKEKLMVDWLNKNLTVYWENEFKVHQGGRVEGGIYWEFEITMYTGLYLNR